MCVLGLLHTHLCCQPKLGNLQDRLVSTGVRGRLPSCPSSPSFLLLRSLASTTRSVPVPNRRDKPRGQGGIVLFTIALIVLGAWVVSLSGVFPGGDLAHVLLLAGLMLLLLAFVKGREAALRRSRAPSPSSQDQR